MLTESHDNKMLASFVPALLLKELEKGANLQMPSSQQYEAVALFAVRLSTSRARISWSPPRSVLMFARISRASRS